MAAAADQVLMSIDKLLLLCAKCRGDTEAVETADDHCKDHCPIDLLSMERIKQRGLKIRDLDKIPRKYWTKEERDLIDWLYGIAP